MDHLEIQETLENSELFRELEKTDIQKISALCHVEVYETSQYLFRQGDLGDRICIIADGQVTLERTVDLGNRKGNVVIGILSKGRFLGCWSTLLNSPHHLLSSASCRKPTKVICLKGCDLRAMMVTNPLLGFRILEKLCLLLRERMQSVYGAMEKI
jgi:CRP/FNR family cyclic AMP-dependent transcriptional regulator